MPRSTMLILVMVAGRFLAERRLLTQAVSSRRWYLHGREDVWVIDGVALYRCDVERVDPERVAAVRERLPDERSGQALAEVFKVLSDVGRVRLIVALLEAVSCACATWQR